jgi:signal transduction histidine kinase/CheY-like chemotaxis protein
LHICFIHVQFYAIKYVKVSITATKLMLSFYQQLIKSSLSSSLRFSDKDNRMRFSLFLLLACMITAAEAAFALYHGLWWIACFNMGVIAFCIIRIRRILVKGKSPQALFFLIFCNLLIGLSVCLEGRAANGFVYYFPLLSVTAIIGNKLRPVKKTGLMLIFLSSLFIVTALFLPEKGLLQYNISPATYQQWFYLKLLLAFALSIANTYIGITLSRRNEVALLNEKAYFNTVFNTSLEAHIIIHKDTITDYNQCTVEMFQMDDPSDFKKLSHTRWLYRHLVMDTPGAEQVINENPAQWVGELTFVTMKRQPFNGLMSVMSFVYNEEEYLKISIRDISSLKKAETELKEAKDTAENAARSKARFLSSMSHELRTPLNGIIGTANLLLQEKDLQSEIVNHINVLKYSSDHMLGIINDILDFSKIEAGKMTMNICSFGIKEYLDKIVCQFEPQFAAKQLSFVCNLDSGLADINILSDEVKLGQVLHNLLSNALKFTLQGQVLLEVAVQEKTESKVTLQFAVADTGVGIPPEKIPEIFEGFTQMKNNGIANSTGGTGLGLTISKKLVELFHGELRAESEPDKGSRFYFSASFEIDNKVRPTYIASNVHVRADNMLRGLRILLVEDNAINMKVAKGFLRKWQANIREAGNGVEALELMRFHTFDIILMDLDMPEMDGYTATRQIRQQGIDIPILAFTAALIEDLEIKLKQTGFDGYILKPFKPTDLYKKIEACLQAHVVFV